MATQAKASFTSNKSTSATLHPALSSTLRENLFHRYVSHRVARLTDQWFVLIEPLAARVEAEEDMARLARWFDAAVVEVGTFTGYSTLCLARDCGLLIAPAMNTNMLAHPAVQQNLAALKARGVQPDVLVSGTMQRHLETAAGALGEMGVELAGMHQHAGVNEFDHENVIEVAAPRYVDKLVMMSDMAASGDPRRTFQKFFQDAVSRWVGGNHDDEYKEPWSVFKLRCISALDDLVKQTPAKGSTLVFTSGGTISVICAHLLGLNDAQAFTINWTLANVGITKLQAGGIGRTDLITMYFGYLPLMYEGGLLEPIDTARLPQFRPARVDVRLRDGHRVAQLAGNHHECVDGSGSPRGLSGAALPMADRVVELTPDFTETTKPPETIEVKAGEVLFEQSTMGELIYLVSEGELDIVRELADGGEELVKVAGPGDYFGEIGVLFHLPRSATARSARTTPRSPSSNTPR